ncbi:MAG: amidohydrolase [Candidatus Neomarinimicrobiota bacterium]|nr:MAG: amidohydrolase [Candidatus Neomarinimicrobiota bacterium]
MKCKPKTLTSLLLMLSITPSQTVLFTHFTLPQSDRPASLLCEHGRILAVNPSPETGSDTTIDLRGGVLYPGFTDAHLHLLGLGQSRDMLDLVGTTSAADIVRQVAQKVNATPVGEWIRGRGWDQNDWKEIRFPDRQSLDAVAPNHPVALTRIDGHALWVNTAALQAAGISPETPDPSGGKIYRDDQGQPTGILVDNAMNLVYRIIPEDSPATHRRQLDQAVRYLNSLGLTAVHDAGTSRETLRHLRAMETEGQLTLRVYAMLNDDPDDYEPYLVSGPDVSDPLITVRALKLYLDGALGSRGAALLQPYSDDPENRGLIVTDSALVAEKVRRFNDAGFQVNVHCIGDRANRMALDIFARNGRPENRNRIEHAQIIAPEDIPRFAELGVIPSMQATHCTSDMYWADERLGAERLVEAYPWQSLIQAGSLIPGGSDAPVEVPNPLWGFYAAITRQDHQGWPAGGWQPREKMTPEQALHMLTDWPAYASFREQELGRIRPGYWADFTVLDRNILSCPPEDVLETQVLFTIVGGRIVYAGPTP